jgi:hypothetical protein
VGGYYRIQSAARTAENAVAIGAHFKVAVATVMKESTNAIAEAEGLDKAVAMAHRDALEAYIIEKKVRVEALEAEMLGTPGPGKPEVEQAREHRRAKEAVLAEALDVRRQQQRAEATAKMAALAAENAQKFAGAGLKPTSPGDSGPVALPSGRIIEISDYRAGKNGDKVPLTALGWDPEALDATLAKVKMPADVRVQFVLSAADGYSPSSVEHRASIRQRYGVGPLGRNPVCENKDGSYSVVLYASRKSVMDAVRLDKLNATMVKSLAAVARNEGGGVAASTASAYAKKQPWVFHAEPQAAADVQSA